MPTSNKSKKNEKKAWPRWLTQERRRIETVIGELVERYRTQKVWARDRWHLTSHWLRKVLSYTMAMFLCREEADLRRCVLQGPLPTETCTSG